MLDLLAFVALLAAAYASGAALLGRFPRVLLDGWAWKLLFRVAAGFGVLGFVVLAVGLAGGLRPWVGWLVVALSLAAGGPVLRREALALRRQAAKTAATPVDFAREVDHPHVVPGGAWPSVLSLGVLLVVAVLGLLAAVTALAPPAAYDELTYHLAAPRIYVQTGQVSILPWDHHTAFPFGLEMLYTLGLLLGGTGTAKLVHTACWALALLAVWLLGRAYLGERAGWLALLVYAATPNVFYEAGLAYTDLGYALYQTLGLIALFEYLNLRVTAVNSKGRPRPRQPQWLGIAGAMAGLAYGTKYTGALVAVFLLAAIVALALRDRLSPRALRVDLLVFALVAALVAAPWIVRTWGGTGNPVFPFAHGVFGSPLWTADRAQAYEESQKEFGRALDERTLAPIEPPGSQRSLARLLQAPWNMTFHPTWFYDRGLNFDGKAALGPAYLAFGLPALVFWLILLRRRPGRRYEEIRDEESEMVYKEEFQREVRVARARTITEAITLDTARVVGVLLAQLVFAGLVWWLTAQHLRYLIPHLATAALLAGWAADGLLRMRLGAVAATVALVMQTAGGLAYGLTGSFPALQVRLGGLEPDRYAAAGLPAYGAMIWINEHTAPDARVILLGEPRGYWLERPYLWGERGHSILVPDELRADPAAYLRHLRDSLRVTHALVYLPVFPLDRTEGADDIAVVARAVAAGLLTEVWRDERRGVVVYELSD